MNSLLVHHISIQSKYSVFVLLNTCHVTSSTITAIEFSILPPTQVILPRWILAIPGYSNSTATAVSQLTVPSSTPSPLCFIIRPISSYLNFQCQHTALRLWIRATLTTLMPPTRADVRLVLCSPIRVYTIPPSPPPLMSRVRIIASATLSYIQYSGVSSNGSSQCSFNHPHPIPSTHLFISWSPRIWEASRTIVSVATVPALTPNPNKLKYRQI